MAALAASEDGAAPFPPLPFQRNESGWGPTTLPAQFVGIPYQDFSKTSRVGQVADFTASRQRYLRERADPVYLQQQTAEKFDLVDTTKQRRTQRLGNKRRGRNNRGQGWRQQQKREERIKKRAQGQSTHNRRWHKLARARRRGRRWRHQENKEASVTVKSTWQLIEQYETSDFSRLRANSPEVVDLAWCGSVKHYDSSYDRVSLRNKKILKRYPDSIFYSYTAMDDPVIEALSGNPEHKAQVFSTDAVITHIMCCARARKPWDIVATRSGGVVFLDKREDSALDQLTVNETSFDPPQDSEEDPDNINSATNLAIECKVINQNFSQQMVDGGEEHKFDNPNPFYDEDDEEESKAPASVAYRYRKFVMGNITMICRTELHGSVTVKSKKQFMTTYAFNEWDPKIARTDPWKIKMKSQPAGVIATELKNNSMKLAKWTMASVLSGADQMKLGFVQRKSPKDNNNHQIISTMIYPPLRFAQQINLSISNMWGVLKMIVDLLLAQPEGKYVIMKDPNKEIIRVYMVPEEESSSDDDSDDSDSDSGSGSGSADSDASGSDEEE